MEKTAEKLKVNESLLKTVLCSATFWGLLAHGMVLFNKYSFHDDARYFNDVGVTYKSGRWMLGILGSLSANLLGSKNYSLPVVNGTITILCIAAIVYLLADSLRIQSKPLVILLCGSMVTFPSVTGTFSYMFTAPYYYAASLLGVVGATFWGLLAHGMVLFNKYSFHDDARYFNDVGVTYKSGRWMLGILGSLSANLLGSKNYSLPVVNGTITILCIAAIVYLLADSLRIQSKPLVILLCGSMVTFPSVTGTFSYMFTAPYYYAASLLGVVGAWIFHQKKNFVALLLCTVLMACSVGVYQANIPVFICTLLLYMMEDVRQSDMSWKTFWKMALCNATVCIGFIAEYFLVNQYFLNQFGVVLTDYKGINHFGRTNLSNYIYRMLCGYGSFFYPSTAVEDFSARYIYTLLIVVTAIIAIFVLRKMYILKTPKGSQTLLILIAYPIAACFVYLMVEPWDVHAVMTFGQAFAFALVVWFIDKYPEDRTKVEGALCKAAVALLGVLVTLNIRYSNILYLKADVMQTQMISYYTTLITRIESVEGYTEDAQVVYIGEYDKHDKNFVGVSEYFDDLDLPTYKGELIFNDYAWKETMELWCGFAPELGDAAEFEGNAEVASMPCYPEQGSIRCIDGKIVVKFADEQ